MSIKKNDIADNEIRIISAADTEKHKLRNRLLRIYLPAAAALLLLAFIVYLLIPSHGGTESEQSGQHDETPANQIKTEISLPAQSSKTGVFAQDTVINKHGLLILSPENLTPKLVLGAENLNDSTIALAAQAADFRADNGGIVGTFVMDGELISRGESKAGYCSIINGVLTIGVSDATPKLEQALTENGYFFRQYPLVVGGQLVENKPKNEAIRKALAELNGKICVIISNDKLTFNDFSSLLVDIGVRNAIYLVGANAYGFYKNETGNRVLIGNIPKTKAKNASFIIWQ